MNSERETSTYHFVQALGELKEGELGLLRTFSNKGLDEAVMAFDLFAGIWWPLRQESPKVPRRTVAWLITKLYAYNPLPYAPGSNLAKQMRFVEYQAGIEARERIRQRFDLLLTSSLDDLEPHLQWALRNIKLLKEPRIDWVKLTDDLSIWEREEIRQRWVDEYLNPYK